MWPGVAAPQRSGLHRRLLVVPEGAVLWLRLCRQSLRSESCLSCGLCYRAPSAGGKLSAHHTQTERNPCAGFDLGIREWGLYLFCGARVKETIEVELGVISHPDPRWFKVVDETEIVDRMRQPA